MHSASKKDMALENRQKIFLYVLCSLVVGGMAGWFLFWRKDSLETTGWKAAECIYKGDGDCMYEYSDSWERSEIGYDEAVLKKYGREYLKPAFASVNLSPTRSASELKGSGYVLATAHFAAPFEQYGIGVRVANTKVGPKVPTLIAESFLAAATILYSDPKLPNPERKVAAWLTACEKDGPNLEKMGLRGIWTDNPDKFYTWSEYAEKTRQQLAKIRQSR